MRKHNFKNLKIWQVSMDILSDVYNITKNYPQVENYGLVSQLRRAAVSVPSNIAEGSSRTSNKDFNRFLEISLGSLFELQTQLIFSKSNQFLTQEQFLEIDQKVTELQKMITGFQKKLT